MEAYNQLLKTIKAEYKPRLKLMSKGQLIDVIVELSARSAAMAQEIKKENDNLSASKASEAAKEH